MAQVHSTSSMPDCASTQLGRHGSCPMKRSLVPSAQVHAFWSCEQVAKFVGADRDEIIFTRGASEAMNLVAYSWGMANLSKAHVHHSCTYAIDLQSLNARWKAALRIRHGASVRVYVPNEKKNRKRLAIACQPLHVWMLGAFIFEGKFSPTGCVCACVRAHVCTFCVC